MQFASPVTARTYSDRAVDRSWSEWAAENLMPAGKDVVDIGCGGGIYSRGFAALGARSVIGVDKTAQYVAEASSGVTHDGAITFRDVCQSDAECVTRPARVRTAFQQSVVAVDANGADCARPPVELQIGRDLVSHASQGVARGTVDPRFDAEATRMIVVRLRRRRKAVRREARRLDCFLRLHAPDHD